MPQIEERAIDRHARNAEPPVAVELLRAIGPSPHVKAQHRAHIIALARFHADSGTKLDETGRPILRASAQRKVNAKCRDIEAIRSLIPGNEPRPAAVSAGSNTLTPNDALLRLYSV
jgi:hypothetical protein